LRSNRHVLELGDQPLHSGLPRHRADRIATDVPQTGVAAFAAISADVRVPSSDAVPDLQDLRGFFFFSGITRQRKYNRRRDLFSGAACTGALYEIELYVGLAS